MGKWKAVKPQRMNLRMNVNGELYIAFLDGYDIVLNPIYSNSGGEIRINAKRIENMLKLERESK